MSTLLKNYIEQLSLEGHQEVELPEMPSLEQYLDLSLENFDYELDAIENAMSTCVALEELRLGFEAQEEHTQASLESFEKSVGLVFAGAGLPINASALMPSLEEANMPATQGGLSAASDKKSGGIKETIKKIIAWIKAKIAELSKKFQEFGGWIALQTQQTIEGVAKLKDKAKAKLADVKAKKPKAAPKSAASAKAFSAELKKAMDLAEKSNVVFAQYAASGKGSDDALRAAIEAVSEQLDKVLAIKSIDISEGVDAATLEEITSMIEITSDALNTVKAHGIKGSNGVKRTIKLTERTIKSLESKKDLTDSEEQVLKMMQQSIKLLQENAKATNQLIAKTIKTYRHAANVANKVINAA